MKTHAMPGSVDTDTEKSNQPSRRLDSPVHFRKVGTGKEDSPARHKLLGGQNKGRAAHLRKELYTQPTCTKLENQSTGGKPIRTMLTSLD